MINEMDGHLLKDLLVNRALVSREYVDWAVGMTGGTTSTWLEQLLCAGAVDEEDVCRCIAETARVARCHPDSLLEVSPRSLARVPPETALEHRLISLGLDGEGYLHLVMVDPTDEAALAEVSFFSGKSVIREIASAGMIAWALHHYYGAETMLWPPPPKH
jgi:hypothetical protein